MSILKDGVLITKRDFLVSTVVFTILFISYYVFTSFIPKHLIASSDNRLIIQASFNFVMAITLIVSGFFVDRLNNLALIYTSTALTMLSTAFLFFVPIDILKIGLLFVIGGFHSLGLLGFVMYFWETTVSEERGRISGLIGLIALPITFSVTYLVAPSLDFLGTLMLSIISLGILVGVLKFKNKAITAKNVDGNYFEKRTVLLYLIPWFLFSLINVTLGSNESIWVSQQASSSFYFFLLALQFLGVFLGCALGGIIADFFGRRLGLVFSLTSYGTSAALLGLFTGNEVLSLVYVVNGLSWGILFTLYIFVVGGDLANKDNYPKMLSIGLASYFLTVGIGFLTQISIPISTSSLATCLVIFLSNIPIAVAPELASLYFREGIKIRRHLKAVKKIGKESSCLRTPSKI